MPYRRIAFSADSYFHVFNRGVEKRIIFEETLDYKVFCDILFYYLNYVSHPFQFALHRSGDAQSGIFKDKISLVSYSLMPNHYHLLLYQKNEVVLSDFMRRIGVTYSMYFNQKYNRVGSLFQGRFKAKLIDTDEYLLQVNKYIHRNSLKITRTGLGDYPWSSYHAYLQPQNILKELDAIVNSKPVLDYFTLKNQSLLYKEFVEMIPQPLDLQSEIETF